MNHEIQYYFQHVFLPKLFFEEKIGFVAVILEKPEILYRMLDDICKNENEENTYAEDAIQVTSSRVTKDILMIKITYPKPTEMPLCYCQYLFFDEKCENQGFFCVEKAMDDPDDLHPFICSWNGEMHQNYGRISMEKEYADMFRCAEIYARNTYGRELREILAEENQ